MIIQSLVSLLSPIAILFVAAKLLNEKASVGPWIYVVLIMLGVFIGLYSMISFIIKTSKAIEAIENQKGSDTDSDEEVSQK
jgi:F0F1-type ATP synthase assembly protein I